MQGVSVASDDVVRKIEAANDRLTRLSNNMKVGFASVIGFITDTSERLGNALAGGAGHTIKELEEVEARYAAIAQLSNEGSRDFVTALATQDMAKQAAMIAERTEQILAKTRDIGQQMSVSEETIDSSLGLEKEKTAELAKQAELLAKQEAQRQEAIKDIGAQVALIEAQLSGNKKLEESLREQADFESAFAKTQDTEEASKFAAAKAAERAAQAANQGGGSGGGSGGGLRSASPRSALQRLEEMSQGGNVSRPRRANASGGRTGQKPCQHRRAFREGLVRLGRPTANPLRRTYARPRHARTDQANHGSVFRRPQRRRRGPQL
jgi:hypothetical protein